VVPGWAWRPGAELAFPQGAEPDGLRVQADEPQERGAPLDEALEPPDATPHAGRVPSLLVD